MFVDAKLPAELFTAATGPAICDDARSDFTVVNEGFPSLATAMSPMISARTSCPGVRSAVVYKRCPVNRRVLGAATPIDTLFAKVTSTSSPSRIFFTSIWNDEPVHAKEADHLGPPLRCHSLVLRLERFRSLISPPPMPVSAQRPH